MEESPPATIPRALWLILAFFVSLKVFIYASIRFLYPFSQYLARDWNLSMEEMTFVIGITEFASIPAGFLGFLGDRLGFSKIVLVSVSGILFFSGLMLTPPIFAGLLIIRFCFGFCLDMSFVSVQSLVTTLFPLERRDGVTGILELAYSVSAIMVVPLLGVIYGQLTWRAPFVILTAFLGVHFPVLVYILYYLRQQPSLLVENDAKVATGTNRLGYCSGWQPFTGSLAYNVSAFAISMGSNLLATEFGILLSNRYLLDEAEAGKASLALGFGELVGVILTTLPCLPPSFFLMEVSGILILALSGLFLALGNSQLEATLVLLFVLFVFIEFGIVQRFARATQFAAQGDAAAMLGVQVQFQFAGRTLGAFLAGVLFRVGGHEAVCGLAIALFAGSVLFLHVALRQHAKHRSAAISEVTPLEDPDLIGIELAPI